MVRSDPYTPDQRYYECLSCRFRTKADECLQQCFECGGDVRNIAVPRE